LTSSANSAASAALHQPAAGEGAPRVCDALGFPTRVDALARVKLFPVPPSVESRFAAFLRGESHGEDLLHALYDHVLDEPIPERLRSLLRR
jgi:hypothetical protein